MANKIAKLTMLTVLFSIALGLGLTSVSEINTTSTPTKQAVSYASEDDLNDHTHTSDWIPLKQEDFDTDGDYVSGTLAGGSLESDTKCYYLNENITLSSNVITISNYVTLCLNGKTLTNNISNRVTITVPYSSFNLCDCSGNNSGTITGATNNDDGNGGAFDVYDSTFNMYGGSISYNTASYGGGVHISDSTFNMYDGIISSNSADIGGGLHVDRAYFNMYGGTITDNTATNFGNGVYADYEHTTSIYGGYFKDDMYNNNINGTISIKGGYFSSDAYSSVDNDWLASNYQFIDISTLEKTLDNNYVDGYPYAVYATSTTSYSVSDVTDVTYGTTYTPTINTDETLYTSVAYTYKDGDNEVLGLPADVGEYTVTAHFLYTTTEGYITTNSYGTTEFKVTINQSSSSTPSDGEDGTDNNSSDDGTTTSSDSTGLSAGTIAGIVIASVFIVGLITFLVYFFVFRKKKATSK